jgi:hypothetical protein
MSPFEVLYRRKINTQVSWDNPTNRTIVGPYLLKDLKDQMMKIKWNSKDTQDRKEIYVDKHITSR